jgi:hypothetical protein
VEALEALHPSRLAEQVERLAHHAFRGEVWEKAVTYLRQAGTKALALLGLPGGGDLLRAGTGGPAATARHAPEGRARDRSSS